MSVLEKNVIGTMHFGSEIDITDPCYDRDVWCRLNDVKIKEGEYTCVAWTDKSNDRVFRCGIYLNGDIPKTYELNDSLGVVGVDAGLCGFFNHKKDYADDEWSTFCNDIGFKKQAWIYDDGFFTSSGWGDGSYDVVGARNDNGELVALELIF